MLSEAVTLSPFRCGGFIVPYNSERHVLLVLDHQTFRTYGTDPSPNTLRTPGTRAVLDNLDRTSEPLRTLWVKCCVIPQGKRCRYLPRYRQHRFASRYSCEALSVVGSSLVTFIMLRVSVRVVLLSIVPQD